MKKMLVATILCASSPFCFGDTIFGIHAGAGQWNSELSGEIGADNDPVSASELGFTDSDNNFIYVAVEHPIPLLPNVRLSNYDVSLSGNAVVSRNFILDNRTFEANADTQSELDISHTDITFYYEILDNWANLDLGVTIRSFDGFAQVTGESSGQTQTERVDLDQTVPMLYSRARFDLPFTGVYAGGALNLISSGDNSIRDLEVYVGYEFDLPLLDLGLRLGLKDLSLETEDNDELTADVTVDGVYAAFTLHL